MDQIITAIIAIASVLLAGYLNNFLAEDYRRFRDGSTLAAALAGELGSILVSLPRLKESIENLIKLCDEGRMVKLPEWPMPSSPVYERGVDKIGLLEVELSRETSFIYDQIRAFRVIFSLSSADDVDQNKAALQQSLMVIVECEDRAKSLVSKLDRRAAIRWRQTERTVLWVLGFFSLCFVGLLSLILHI
ncbi:hypothetical protein [Pseudomonas frederiksbergensis]|uniref:hypothetical protein n=1 Tax=Pseudomonas frederiksbergensis TaxID=104087 RepID=UPI0011CD4DDF|nr:hypothetical protein [Pseudomonas frederiksbergensis]